MFYKYSQVNGAQADDNGEVDDNGAEADADDNGEVDDNAAEADDNAAEADDIGE